MPSIGLLRVFAAAPHCLAMLLSLWSATIGVSLRAGEVESEFSPAQVEFFERQIRPLFVERCQECHGAEAQEAGLRLDSRAAILTGGDGGPAAIPGQPDGSRLWEVVGYTSDVKMPPDGKLSAAELSVLRAWITEGLAWPDESPPAPSDPKPSAVEHLRPWSFAPLTDPSVPEVRDAAWSHASLDRFVLARLEAAGLRPAPPADRRALIRRATVDLLGVLPTIDEIDDFVADREPDAYARLIDRLLASPQYGQRWGRHWLDVARYADSNGQDENLAYVNAYRYRDWVVDALNADLPYDQFVQAQVAGDLLPATNDAARLRQLTATGFLCLGPKMLAEDDPAKMQMDIIDEQLDTLGAAVLGMTLGCARCHDHKFDPISMRDYYALAGIFKSTRTMDNFKVVAQWHERPLATPAEIAQLAAHQLAVTERTAERDAIATRANAALVAAARARRDDYVQAARELLATPPLASRLQLASDAPAPEGTLLVEAEDFARGNVLVDTTTYGAGIGIILNRGELPNFIDYDVVVETAGRYQLELRYAAATARSVRLLVNGVLRKVDAAGEVTGSWNPDGQRWFAEDVFDLAAGATVIRLERREGPIPHFDRLALLPVAAATSELAATSNGAPRPAASLGDLASARSLVPAFVKQWADHLRQNAEAGATDAASNSQSAEQQPARIEQAAADEQGPFRVPPEPEQYYAATDRDALAAANAALQLLQQAAPPAPPQAMAVEEGTPEDVAIHLRGSHWTQGESVARGFPVALAASAPEISAGATGRLELARWLTDARQPLTARVVVNRLWRWHFGAGLVRSCDNFGNLGEPPSHPELLDWLASRLIEADWSWKSLHRELMLSATYQMSAAHDSRAAELDPDNRLLWRMNRRRMEAEVVRDTLLQVSGELDARFGGTLLEAKPREYVASTTSINKTKYDSPRRSLYLPVVRSALYELYQAFDFAEPTVTKGDRERTTGASQALLMMNSTLVTRQAELLAQRTMEMSADERLRVDHLYRSVLGRSARDDEQRDAAAFLAAYRPVASEEAGADADLAAWQALARVLLSSSEFLYLE